MWTLSCTAPFWRRKTRLLPQLARGLAAAAAEPLPELLEAAGLLALETVDVRPAPSRRLMLPSMKAPASIARLSWIMSPMNRVVFAITTDFALTAPSTVPQTRTVSQLMLPLIWAHSPTVREERCEARGRGQECASMCNFRCA